MRNRAYKSQMMGSNMKWRARPASMVSLLKLEQQEQRRKRENTIMTMLILSLLVQMTTLLVLVLTFELPFIADMNSVTNEVPLKLIPRIDKDFPSADIIKAILLEEQHTLVNHNDTATVGDMANVYELVYAFISAFQRHAIPIFVGYGSHLGARRHHGKYKECKRSFSAFCNDEPLTTWLPSVAICPGIIPFGDENVDLEVFSVDEAKVSEVINEVLHVKDSWSNITVSEIGFGSRLNNETMAKHGFKYYIDFFLFNSNIAKDRHVRCKGLQLGYMNGIRPNPSYGCNRWYRRVHGMSAMPPKFQWSDYFPPLYQVS